MIEKEGTRGLTVTKIIVYAVLSFLGAAFQTSVGERIALFSAAPQITLALTCAAAYFGGALTGAYTGIVSGVLTEAMSGIGVVTLPLFYCILGWIIGALATEKSGRTGFAFASLSLLISLGAGIIFTIMRLVVGGGKPNIFLGVIYIALPEALNTLIWGILIFALHAAAQIIVRKSTSR